jgi:predicted nucleotidyltransferase component of viral defense system
MFEQALDARTLLLIKTISKISSIAEKFYLAGGTALSLHLCHRRSEDTDLFTEKKFPLEAYVDEIKSLNGQVLTAEEGSIHCIVNDAKLSLLYYPYPLIKPLKKFYGIKVASVDDIACMKIVAVSQRGEKKDFFDIYEIAKIYELSEIRRMFHEKYKQKEKNCYHILKSLFYFDDTEESPNPISLKGITWDEVKNDLLSRKEEITNELLCS